MEWIGFLLLVAGFLVLLKLTRLPTYAHDVITISKVSMATAFDRNLSDRKKEKLMQRNALQLFKLTFILLAGCTLALAGPALVLYAIEYAGLVRFNDVLTLAIEPFVIAVTTLLIIPVLIVHWRQP